MAISLGIYPIFRQTHIMCIYSADKSGTILLLPTYWDLLGCTPFGMGGGSTRINSSQTVVLLGYTRCSSTYFVWLYMASLRFKDIVKCILSKIWKSMSYTIRQKSPQLTIVTIVTLWWTYKNCHGKSPLDHAINGKIHYFYGHFQ